MANIERFQVIIIIGAMMIGLGLGQVTIFEDNFGALVTPFLFVMLFGAFLNIPLGDFGKALGNVRFSMTVVVVNFVWTPLLVWALGGIFLDDPIMQIGFIMLMVTPCTDWYLIFTANAKGNVPLSASVLPVNLILQVVLLPVYLFIFTGASNVSIDAMDLIKSILVMLVIPFSLAQVGKHLLRRKGNEEGSKRTLGFFSSMQTMLLALAIMAMFTSKGNDLIENMDVVLLLIIPIFLFYVINFMIAHAIGRRFRYAYEDTTSLVFTTIAKNSPMTLGVALVAFPDQPLIHLIMVIEPLIELPVMFMVTRIVLRIRGRVEGAERPVD